MLQEDFAVRFERQFPHRIGQRLLVALSGGADSVALLHLLRQPELRLTLEAAHVHHLVRGSEADEDAEFCRSLCNRLDLRFHLLHIDPEIAPDEGREAAWRRARYRLLEELRHQRRLAGLVTAHHRDDVAEGVLMQLLRGGGTRALAGIAAETSNDVIRPLLEWNRADILEWLTENGHTWCEDSSNRDLAHLRNKVRHEILPSLRPTSPGIDSHLVALAGRLAEDEAFFSARLREHDLWIDPWAADGGVPLDEVRELPAPLRSRWLHAQAERTEIGRVSRRQLEIFNKMIQSGAPRAVTLASRWRLVLARGRLWLEPPEPLAPYAIELKIGTRVKLPIPGMEVRFGVSDEEPAGHIWRWKATPETRLSVRSSAPGDAVAHGTARVKLSTMLAKHLPRHLRRAWPVFSENGTIAWIPGVWQASECGNLPVEVVAHGRTAGRVHR